MSDSSDRVQIGPEVDADLWASFRQSVEDRHGSVRGNLGKELENAIRHYVQHGPDESVPGQLADIQARLSRIEEATDATTADGGVDRSTTEYTHTRDLSPPDSKPAPNTSTDKKLAWLAKCVREQRPWVEAAASAVPDELGESAPDPVVTNQIATTLYPGHNDKDGTVADAALELVTDAQRERVQAALSDPADTAYEPLIVARDTLRDIVKDEYGFRSDTARRYVDELVSHFGLVDHPVADSYLVTESEQEAMQAVCRTASESDAGDRLDEIANAEVVGDDG